MSPIRRAGEHHFRGLGRKKAEEFQRVFSLPPHSIEGYLTSLRQEAKGLRERERDRKLKAAADAATTALRYLRGMKFVDPSKPTRRPGRPPGKPRPAGGSDDGEGRPCEA
jgi:hypothetical protein